MNRPAEVTIKPPRLWRACGWALATFGALFGLAGIGEDVGVTVSMLVAGIVFILVGTALATAVVRANGDCLLYRSGWTRRIAANDVAGVRLGPGSGAYYDRVAIFVDRRRGRPLRLIALQLPDTTAGREQLAAHVADLKRALLSNA